MGVSEEQRARTLARFNKHRQAWERNEALGTLYADWYARVRAALPPEALGPRVELGSGPGFARGFIPGMLLTDLVAAPWHDRELSAEELPFDDASVGALVLFDVIHHLPSPRRFFAEAARVLRPGGRVVACEPYLSPFSYPIYKLFHQEALNLRADPLGDAGAEKAERGGRDPFDANQAIPTLLFFGRARRAFEAAFPALAVRRTERFAGLSYPASGGFSRSPLLPRILWSALHRLEARLPQVVFRIMGFRMLVVLERLRDSG